MADTAVAITAGTGTNIDTRTEATNGNHRQVVVLGDPATNAGVAPVDATSGLSVNVTNASLTVASHAVTNAGTFAVQNTAATPAGTNIVGKVGIDQTTDGTTNLVAAKQSGTWTFQPGNTANTTPWLAKLSDGTNAVAVKAASTAPVATDPAIVVALSPNGLNANGRTTPANSAPMVLASQTSQFVAASATATQLGSTGATGDWLDGILIIPATTAAGAVSVLWDGTNTRQIFAGGGTTALTTLIPFYVPFGAISGNSGGFKITTGANVSVICFGNFT